MSEHAQWNLGHRHRDNAEVRAGYKEAKRAIALGKAVRGRRLAMGLSRTELAERTGMTQSVLSRLEAGATVPAIPVLDRLAHALEAELVIGISPHAAF